jgi:predicted MFS family arabinose efflux permease
MTTDASARAPGASDTPPEPNPDQARATMSAQAWAMLLVLCGAIFLEGIDVAMLNVALPSIRADLGMSTGEVTWVVSAYVLGYGGLMLLGGRAADLLGRRRMFLGWRPCSSRSRASAASPPRAGC